MDKKLTGMRFIPDKESYIKFIDHINKMYFQDMQQTEEFFGLELAYDEDGYYTEDILDYKGNIRLCPEEFPVVIFYNFDIQVDPRGCGKTYIRYLDWATTTELGIKSFEYEAPKFKQCKWKQPILAEHAWKRCKNVCDGYCTDCAEYWAEGTNLGFTEEEWAKYLAAEQKEQHK